MITLLNSKKFSILDWKFKKKMNDQMGVVFLEDFLLPVSSSFFLNILLSSSSLFNKIYQTNKLKWKIQSSQQSNLTFSSSSK